MAWVVTAWKALPKEVVRKSYKGGIEIAGLRPDASVERFRVRCHHCSRWERGSPHPLLHITDSGRGEMLARERQAGGGDVDDAKADPEACIDDGGLSDTDEVVENV